MAARRTTAETTARRTRSTAGPTAAKTRHTRTAATPPTPSRVPAPRAAPVIEVRPLVEDDTEVLAAEHAARDAQLLDLVSRLSA